MKKNIKKISDSQIEIETACGADLMSDVLAFAHSESTALLTGLTNPQVVTTSDMAGISIIIFVRGKIPPPETISLANERGIPLLMTPYTGFEACGRLYMAGIESCDVRGYNRQCFLEKIRSLK